MEKLPNHTALKEWASVISALAAGDQVVLVRKGGIADPKFGLEADRFYLFPTYLHQEEKQFKPERRAHFETTRSEGGEPAQVTIRYWCEVARTFHVAGLERLRRLEPFVIFTGSTIEERFRFRADQAVHVIAVKTWELPAPVTLEVLPEYTGCRSWVSVDAEIDITGSSAMIRDPELQQRIAAIDSALQMPASEAAQAADVSRP
jgi:hypothetical protein